MTVSSLISVGLTIGIIGSFVDFLPLSFIQGFNDSFATWGYGGFISDFERREVMKRSSIFNG